MRMFRGKKTVDGEIEVPSNGERVAMEEDPSARNPLRRLPAMPGRTLAGASFPIDIPRRPGGDGPANARPEAPSAPNRDKTIVIGRDVRISGQVHVCDRLILDGDAELAVSDCRLLQIGASGKLRGTVEVTEADIGGRFEGTLSVSERLTVRATGRIVGTVRYGQIVVEAGGRVCGDVATTAEEDASAFSPASPSSNDLSPAGFAPAGLSPAGLSPAGLSPAGRALPGAAVPADREFLVATERP